jgi:hypothetical protein
LDKSYYKNGINQKPKEQDVLVGLILAFCILGATIVFIIIIDKKKKIISSNVLYI